MPCAAQTCRTRLFLRGSPATLITNNDGGSAPVCNSCVTADGTVLSKVACSLAAGSWRAFTASITLPPEHNGTNSSNMDKSKQIDVDAMTPAKASTSYTSRAHDQSATVL